VSREGCLEIGDPRDLGPLRRGEAREQLLGNRARDHGAEANMRDERSTNPLERRFREGGAGLHDRSAESCEARATKREARLPGYVHPRILAFTLLASTFAAREVAAAPEYSRIDRGVWEIDVGALGVFSFDRQNGMSVSRLSTDFNVALSYFIRDDVSVGVQALVAYDDTGDGATALTYGGALDAAVHLRLGLGAFFRPGIAIGALFGNRDVPVAAGTFQQVSQAGAIARLGLPIAYFASQRVLLEAGPEIDVTFGSYSLPDGTSQGFTRAAGGFAVGVGYIF
jgi:hypothetical protein